MNGGAARGWTARRTAAAFALAARRWMAPRTSLFAAALAFYALLALAPILLLILSVGGRLLGAETARASLSEAAVRFAGPGADQVAGSLVGFLPASHWNLAGTLIGATLLIYFASSFFSQLRAALDAVWEAP